MLHIHGEPVEAKLGAVTRGQLPAWRGLGDKHCLNRKGLSIGPTYDQTTSGFVGDEAKAVFRRSPVLVGLQND
jgi:hypothetical protein